MVTLNYFKNKMKLWFSEYPYLIVTYLPTSLLWRCVVEHEMGVKLCV
jgi:hypothetical protein